MRRSCTRLPAPTACEALPPENAEKKKKKKKNIVAGSADLLPSGPEGDREDVKPIADVTGRKQQPLALASRPAFHFPKRVLAYKTACLLGNFSSPRRTRSAPNPKPIPQRFLDPTACLPTEHQRPSSLFARRGASLRTWSKAGRAFGRFDRLKTFFYDESGRPPARIATTKKVQRWRRAPAVGL